MARLVGLDLGSYSIKVVHVSGRPGEERVEAVFEEQLPQVVEHVDGTKSTLVERQEVALRTLQGQGALAGEQYISGLPGDAAALRTLYFPFSDSKKIEATIAFELEDVIPFDIDDVIFDWKTLGECEVQGETMTEVLVAYARREQMQEHLDLLERVEIDPRHVEFSALALQDLYTRLIKPPHEGPDEITSIVDMNDLMSESGPEHTEPGIAIVDIGHSRTSVCIFTEDRAVAATAILHGGQDATRLLARELGLSSLEAERGKKSEAFIEVGGAVAQFPEQKRVSDILKSAYSPIARRLRQLFQATVSSHRIRVNKVYLTGGGSRVVNLERHFAETLHVQALRTTAVDDIVRNSAPLPMEADLGPASVGHPQLATALAYGLIGVAAAAKDRSMIDFRTDEFAWRGELEFLRERAAAIGIWMVVLFLLISAGGIMRWGVLSRQEAALREKQKEVCKNITGQEIESSSRCLAIINENIGVGGNSVIPDLSALDTYIELAARLPEESVITRKVTRLDIKDNVIRMTGITSDFDAVDKIVGSLKGGRCFEEINKGKASKSAAGVEFNINIDLDCDKAPGTPRPKRTAASTSSTSPSAKSTVPALGGLPEAPSFDRSADRPLTRDSVQLNRPEGDVSEAAEDRRARRREELRERLKRARETRKQGISPRDRLQPVRPPRGGDE